ncbi:MAG: ATP-binding protein [Anaerolineales bacterium]
MSDTLCPVCAHKVEADNRYCQSCGVDLALVMAMAERVLSSSPARVEESPVSPEILVPRLGEHLVEAGIINEEELQVALDYQKKRAAEGKPVLIGQALLHLTLIDQASLDKAVTAQILQLQAALSKANRNLEKRVQERTADLRRALNKLAGLNQLKSNFVSNISHELRTPLTHIKGYLELLVAHEFGLLSDEQVNALKVMQHATNRLEGLINDLIKFSQTARGNLSLQLAPVSVQSLIGSVVARLAAKAKARNVAIETKITPDLPFVQADDENIRWALHQLLDNAIKFTSPGGQVTVTGYSEDHQVTIAVIDTGIGIPSHRIEEIFEPFHQLDSSSTRRYGGTGIGLTLVKRILEAHQSSLEVQSKPGKGSCFQFSLPVIIDDNGVST